MEVVVTGWKDGQDGRTGLSLDQSHRLQQVFWAGNKMSLMDLEINQDRNKRN